MRTAALIALIGPVGDPKSTEVYQALVSLFFTDNRIKFWSAGLEKVPAEPSKILLLCLSAQAAGAMEPVEKAKFGLVTFIQVALQLPDPKGYVSSCMKENHRLIRSAFHPNTLTFIGGKYRGVVGALADTEFRESISSTIKTIS